MYSMSRKSGVVDAEQEDNKQLSYMKGQEGTLLNVPGKM